MYINQSSTKFISICGLQVNNTTQKKKKLGVRPTGIGEVPWRIIGKSILKVVGEEEYGDRVREVKCAVFTPLVFSTTGGMGKERTVAYKHLAELIAQK